MKKNKLIIVFTFIVLILLLVIYATFKSKNFDVNINVTNNASSDLDIDMSILLRKENTSTSEKIISMATLKKGIGNKQKATVNAPEGDFGLILKIDEKDNSLYFISGKKIFSAIGTNGIKPIVVKRN